MAMIWDFVCDVSVVFGAVGGLGNLAEVKVFDVFFLNGKPTRPNHKNQRCSENTFPNFHTGSLFTSLGFIFKKWPFFGGFTWFSGRNGGLVLKLENGSSAFSRAFSYFGSNRETCWISLYMRRVVERELHLPPQNIWFLISVHELLSELIPFGGNSLSFTINNFLFMVKIDWLWNDGKNSGLYICPSHPILCFHHLWSTASRCSTEYPEAHHQPPRMTTIPPRLFDLSDVIKSLIRDSDEKKRWPQVIRVLWLFSFACRVFFFLGGGGGGHWYCLGLM